MRWSAIYYTGYALALGQIERVVVDTTVQEKAITHPTDARLIHRAIEKLARLAHDSPPTANLAVKGTTNRPNPESQNARKPRPATGFLAKSNTCPDQIAAINQRLPNTSRTTFCFG